MNRFVVDTNVPVVANGRLDESRSPSLQCRIAAIEFLTTLLRAGRIVLDLAGRIQEEYHRYLSPRGQPGVGDRFYPAVLQSAPRRIERVPLPTTASGDYADCPDDAALQHFDRSDRKFAALARRERIPIANATDSDWRLFSGPLNANGIQIRFVCGCDPRKWFAT